ncbi:MAG TPA: hypothetical protein VGE52_04245 [Pirellulales bacterium]
MPEASVYDRLAALERAFDRLARAVDRMTQRPSDADRVGLLRVGVAAEAIPALSGGLVKVSRFLPGDDGDDDGDEDWLGSEKKVRVRNYTSGDVAAGDRVVFGKSREDGQWYLIVSGVGPGCAACGPRTAATWTVSLSGDLGGTYTLNRSGAGCGWSGETSGKTATLSATIVDDESVVTLTVTSEDGTAVYKLTAAELDCCEEQTLTLDAEATDDELSGLGGTVTITPSGGDCGCRGQIAGLSADDLPRITMDDATLILAFDGAGCLGVVENEECPE